MHINGAESPTVVSVEVTRVLGIPEVLARILENATRGTNAVALRVCRFWFDVGMEILWRDLDVLVPLFTLVEVPLRFRAKPSGGFWEGPSIQTFRPGDWNRFQLYAASVKRLTYDAGISCYKRESSGVSSTAILALAYHQPSGHALLPNLRTLMWKEQTSNENIVSIMPFLSSMLTHLELHHHVTYDDSAEPPFVALFQSLRHRSPSLHSFSLTTTMPVPDVKDVRESLVNWLSSHRSLRQAALQSHLMTPQVLMALAKHDVLRSLTLHGASYRTLRGADTTLSISLGSFSSLETLELDTDGDNMIDLFSPQAKFSKLQTLRLVCDIGKPTERLATLSSGIATCCPHLSTLQLHFHSGDSAQLSEANSLSYSDISPLSACRELSILIIGHSHPFLLREDDIEDMGRAWPALRHLLLCPDPSADHFRENPSSGNPITILKHIARCLSSLITLGLYFDPVEKADLVVDEVLPDHAFTSLMSLMVGISKVPDDDPLMVGQFLESICFTVPTISIGLVTDFRCVCNPERFYDWWQRWTEVTRTFSVFRARRLGSARR